MAILVGTLKLLGSPVNMFGDSINCILITQISLFNRIDLWRREKVHEFHENCLSVTFYFRKKTPNDDVTPQLQSQFTPKMKANAVPRLLSYLL